VIPEHSIFPKIFQILALKLIALNSGSSYIEAEKSMLSRHRILFLIPVIILIPVLLGMTPLNLFQKLSDHCPPSQEKKIQRASSCLFHSIVSQDDIGIKSLNLSLPEKESTTLFHVKVENSARTNFLSRSSPLRC
jgi:hypothetical protein